LFILLINLFGGLKMAATDMNFISVDPIEICFAFELNQQISCSLRLSNKTEDHVGFKVKTTSPKKYCVRPNSGILPPRSSSDITITMQAQKEAPVGMLCRDKFLIQSILVDSTLDAKDVTSDMVILSFTIDLIIYISINSFP